MEAQAAGTDREPSMTRIVVEMSRGRRPLAGTLISDDHRALAFTGWLELVAAIEQARVVSHDDSYDEG